MTAIIIPRRHYTQPQGRVQISSAPVCDGLIAAYCGQSVELVSETLTAASEQYGLRECGRTVISGFTAPVGITEALDEMTCFAFIALLPNTNGGVVAMIGDSAGDSDVRVFPYTSGLGFGFVLYNSPAYNGYQELRITLPAGYVGPVVMRYRRNGLLTIKALSGENSAVALDRSVFIGTTRLYAAPSVGMGGLALFRRYISDEEEVSLLQAPWQLFRADPIRIYSLPSGAISWSSLTASNITQTGARLTLGGIAR